MKEMTGWRGRGRVVPNDYENGAATVQWQNRNLIVHCPHSRRHVYSSDHASNRSYAAMLFANSLTTQLNAPFEHVKEWMQLHTRQQRAWNEHCGWYLPPFGRRLSDFAQQHIQLVRVVLQTAALKMRMSSCIVAQLSHGVCSFSGVAECDSSVLVVCNSDGTMLQVFESPGTTDVDLEHLHGRNHANLYCMRRRQQNDDPITCTGLVTMRRI